MVMGVNSARSTLGLTTTRVERQQRQYTSRLAVTDTVVVFVAAFGAHLLRFGFSTEQHTIGDPSFAVEIGDQVLCPPTPRGDGSWNTGMVVALDGGGYAGPVKYVRKIENEE